MQNKKEQRAKNLEMIGQWQQSGLTQRAFCATHNIAYHVFHYYYYVVNMIIMDLNKTKSFCGAPNNIAYHVYHYYYGVYSMRITDLNKTKCHFFNISLTCWKLCKMI